MAFVDEYISASNHILIIPGTTLYHFGILTSSIYMAWMRLVAGRLKSDYNYSAIIVYNEFLWPNSTVQQKDDIEKAAQGVFDARALYHDNSLADFNN